MHKTIILLILSAWIACSSAQELEKYEPPDGRVIHGLGQYISVYYTNEENWQYVKEYENAVNLIPVIYSIYSVLDPFLNSLDPQEYTDFISGHDYPYLLNIGLMLFDSTYIFNKKHIPVTDILSGVLDSAIINIAQRIKQLAQPVFFRPGFEFGQGNNGFHNDPDMSAEDFIRVWIYLYEIFESQSVKNVAWVWNTVNPNSFNYMDWYPGNEYVNWWGINYFTLSQIDNGDGFLNDAAIHHKPVIVCESSPIQNDGTNNGANWNDWFVPYFKKVKDYSHIKSFIYISDPWDRGPFSSWPDSRINQNELIRSNYTAELIDSMYIHMDEYLENPGLITRLPGSVNKFRAKTFDIKFKNYPNPFNSRTTFRWDHDGINKIELRIYDVHGTRIDSIIPDNQAKYITEVTWNAAHVPSGIYFVRLIFEDRHKCSRQKIQKITLLK